MRLHEVSGGLVVAAGLGGGLSWAALGRDWSKFLMAIYAGPALILASATLATRDFKPFTAKFVMAIYADRRNAAWPGVGSGDDTCRSFIRESIGIMVLNPACCIAGLASYFNGQWHDACGEF